MLVNLHIGYRTTLLAVCRQIGQHLPDRKAESGMNEIRGDIGQRAKDERPLVHSWMRNREFRRFHRNAAIENDIQIKNSRPETDTAICPAADRFDML